MRYWIVNLTRLGDLLQTQAVIRSLKDQGHEVGLVCLENFASAAELLYGVDVLMPLPGATLLAQLESDWKTALSMLQGWLNIQHTAFAPDIVLNLTASLSGRVFTGLSLLPQSTYLGFGLDEYGFGVNATAWATYVQAVTTRRSCSPYNLVDGFLWMAKCPPKGQSGLAKRSALRKPTPEVQQGMAQKLAEELCTAGLSLPGSNQGMLTPVAGLVGFQLGASENRRRWPTENFAALGDFLWAKFSLVPVLLGSAGEKELAEKYRQKSQSPSLDMTGKTTLPQLAALLGQCRLLVSNDTGTMHLAAGLDVPVLALFLATAQPWDTGPYTENACCLEPALSCHPCGFGQACPFEEKCRHSIDASVLQQIIAHWIDSGQWQIFPGMDQQVRAWQPFQTLESNNGGSSFTLRQILPPGKESSQDDRLIWILWQRILYSQLLDAMDISDASNASNTSGAWGQLGKLGMVAGLGQDTLSSNEAELLQSYAQLALPSMEKQAQILSLLSHAGTLLSLMEEQALLLEKISQRAESVPQAMLQKSQLSFLNAHQKFSALLEGDANFAALAHVWTVMVQDRGGNLTEVRAFVACLRRILHVFNQAFLCAKSS